MTRSPGPPDDRRVDPLLEVREKRRGKRPGDAYVKIVRPFESQFERGEEEGTSSPPRNALQRSGGTAGRARRLPKRTLIGGPIAPRPGGARAAHQDEGLAVLSTTPVAPSRTAPRRFSACWCSRDSRRWSLSLPSAVAIVALLLSSASRIGRRSRRTRKAAVPTSSPRTTSVRAAGPAAGAAFLFGYIVTVSVSISAGVAALTSDGAGAA